MLICSSTSHIVLSEYPFLKIFASLLSSHWEENAVWLQNCKLWSGPLIQGYQINGPWAGSSPCRAGIGLVSSWLCPSFSLACYYVTASSFLNHTFPPGFLRWHSDCGYEGCKGVWVGQKALTLYDLVTELPIFYVGNRGWNYIGSGTRNYSTLINRQIQYI